MRAAHAGHTHMAEYAYSVTLYRQHMAEYAYSVALYWQHMAEDDLCALLLFRIYIEYYEVTAIAPQNIAFTAI